MRVQNYRGFTDYEIDFDPRLTVLVGNNGTGKTTILDAMAVALGTYVMNFEDYKGVPIARRDVRVRTLRVGGVIDQQEQYPVIISASGQIGGSYIDWVRELRSAKGSTLVSGATELTSIAKSYRYRVQEGDESIVLPLVAYYGVGRATADKLAGKAEKYRVRRTSRTLGYLNCLGARPSSRIMADWMQKMTMAALQGDEDAKGRLDVTLSAIAQCLSVDRYAVQTENDEGLKWCDNVRVEFNLQQRELVVLYSRGEEVLSQLPASKLSDGYRNVLNIVGDIAYRMVQLNPSLRNDVLQQTPGIVLIDEIDLHLHPSWQQRVLHDLQHVFPKVQFVVTTHAPLVVASARQESLRMLEPSGAEHAEVETYGKDASTALRLFLDSDDSQPEIVELFNEFNDALLLKDFDLAQNRLDELEHILGDSERIAGARAALEWERFDAEVDE